MTLSKCKLGDYKQEEKKIKISQSITEFEIEIGLNKRDINKRKSSQIIKMHN